MSDQARYPLWLLGLSATQAGTALVFLSFAGTLPFLQAEWQVNNTQMGAVQAAGQVGYALAVVIISSLSDYVSPKKLIVGGALWAGLSNIAFAAFAHDTSSAVFLRVLVGLGVAGIYMPGVKFISENIPSDHRGRAVGMFVAAFTVGAAVSIALSGNLATLMGWRAAFGVISIGPLVGALITLKSLPATKGVESQPHQPMKISEMLRNRAMILIIIMYVSHAWELLGLRSWLTAYLTAVRTNAGATLADATRSGATVAGIATLLAAAATASIAALSDKYSRNKIIIAIMWIGFFFTLFLGFTIALPWLGVIGVSLAAAFFTNADSAVISTALTESTPVNFLGRTLALYSFLGFTAGSISPIIFGAVLDLANTNALPSLGGIGTSWSWAFATLALGSATGLVAAYLLRGTSRI
jgi:MFS family permease